MSEIPVSSSVTADEVRQLETREAPSDPFVLMRHLLTHSWPQPLSDSQKVFWTQCVAAARDRLLESGLMPATFQIGTGVEGALLKLEPKAVQEVQLKAAQDVQPRAPPEAQLKLPDVQLRAYASVTPEVRASVVAAFAICRQPQNPIHFLIGDSVRVAMDGVNLATKNNDVQGCRVAFERLHSIVFGLFQLITMKCSTTPTLRPSSHQPLQRHHGRGRPSSLPPPALLSRVKMEKKPPKAPGVFDDIPIPPNIVSAPGGTLDPTEMIENMILCSERQHVARRAQKLEAEIRATTVAQSRAAVQRRKLEEAELEFLLSLERQCDIKTFSPEDIARRRRRPLENFSYERPGKRRLRPELTMTASSSLAVSPGRRSRDESIE